MERRNFVRVNTLEKVHCRLKGQPRAQTQLAESRNVSEDGIRLFLNEPLNGPLAVGQEILFTIHRHDTQEEQWPEISGVIAWHAGDADLQGGSGNTKSVGISFSMTDPVVKDRIHRWMEEVTTAPAREKAPLQLPQEVERRSAPPQIRDSEFESFAKKASAIFKESDKHIRLQVEDFFNKDVRQFHEDVTALAHELTNGKMESDEVEKTLTTLTNNLLLKGNALEAKVDNKVGMKKIKQLFRELTGCWFYQSPIGKMSYEKPRGVSG